MEHRNMEEEFNDHEGGGKFTVDDIVRGKRTLSNGAVAGYVMDGLTEKWRIVQGAPASQLNEIRKRKTSGTPATKIGPTAADRAMKKYYTGVDKTNRNNKPRFTGETTKDRKKQAHKATIYDFKHSRPAKYIVEPNTPGYQKWLRDPNMYDLKNYDDGPLPPKKVTNPKGNTAALEKYRAGLKGGAGC